MCGVFFISRCNEGSFQLRMNFIRRKVSKLSIVELTISDNYWIETITIDPYYRDAPIRNTSIFQCIGQPLMKLLTGMFGNSELNLDPLTPNAISQPFSPCKLPICKDVSQYPNQVFKQKRTVWQVF